MKPIICAYLEGDDKADKWKISSEKSNGPNEHEYLFLAGLTKVITRDPSFRFRLSTTSHFHFR